MRLVKRKCFLSTIYTHCDIWFHLLSYNHDVEQVLVVPLFLCTPGFFTFICHFIVCLRYQPLVSSNPGVKTNYVLITHTFI